MEDTDIVIDVRLMNSGSYEVTAHYNGEEKIRGLRYAGDSFMSLICGRSLQDEINCATLNAVKDLKRRYEKNVEERDRVKSLTAIAQSYAEKCIKDRLHEEDMRTYL